MNTMKTWLLMTVLTILLVLLGNTVGGSQGMIIALIFAIGMNFFSYWYSDKIILKLYRAEEVNESHNPELLSMVRSISTRAQLPMPKVYLIPSDSPNAFATGRNPEHAVIGVTAGLLNLLSRDELEGVLAHEMAHIKNRDILLGAIVASLAGAVSMLGSIIKWGAIFGGFNRDDNEEGSPIVAIAMAIIAPIVALLIQMAISRSREYLADKEGARLAGNPKKLSNALKRLHNGVQMSPMSEAGPATSHMFIVNPFTGKGMLALLSTHPPIEERIARLESM